MRNNDSNSANQSGMALVIVMMMLVVMTTVGVGMYRLVSGSIRVSSAFWNKSTTRSVAVAQGAMVMETIAASITAGTIVTPPGLIVNDPDFLADLYGNLGSDLGEDTPEFNPDFTFSLVAGYGRIIDAAADVDFLQSIPMAGGAIEFASAYDGVGAGQTLGSSYLISERVKVMATDRATGARTVISFISDN